MVTGGEFRLDKEAIRAGQCIKSQGVINGVMRMMEGKLSNAQRPLKAGSPGVWLVQQHLSILCIFNSNHLWFCYDFL